jgi:vacuolar-type H+-ATPase subunit H
MRRQKREINLADYIERLRELQRQSKTPAKEDSPKKTATADKSAENGQRQEMDNFSQQALRNDPPLARHTGLWKYRRNSKST